MTDLFRKQELFQLFLAHLREIVREPGVIFWGILFPILMALGLGIAFTQKADVTHQIAFIESVDHQSVSSGGFSPLLAFFQKYCQPLKNDQSSYQLIVRDTKLGNTRFIFRPSDWQEAMILLKRGKISVILDENKEKIIYHFDPLNPEAQLTYLQLNGLFKTNETKYQTAEGVVEPLTVSGSRYIDFLIPGLISMGVMMSCMWGISYGIIDKRSKKLLRRMIATPMRKSYFLLTLIIVRTLLNFIESGLLFLFAWLVFDITIQGNIPALLVIFLAGNICFAGIAIFVSSHTANTEIGNGLINVVVLPMMVLSGIFFSYHNFPDWAIPYIEKFPLTMLADGVRSVFIEGAGYVTLLFPSFMLTLIGMLFFIAGLRVFKWY
jgi:ABC-2 type transport system permease protein